MAEFNYSEYIKNNPLLTVVEEKLLTESLEEGKSHDGEILSYIADTYIQNAKDGDSAFAAFRDLNINDAVQDVVGILQDPKHPLHGDTKAEYGIVEKDKARGLFEEKGKEDAPSSKTTVSELKAEIKEMIKASLNEVDEDEAEEDIDIEGEMDADPEMEAEPTMDSSSSGMTPEEEQVQDSLQQALAAAQAIGDEKLVDQIGNSITFFTRTHVVER